MIKPKVKRLKAGYYEMTCGEERLRIWKNPRGRWKYRVHGDMTWPGDDPGFASYDEARSAAYEWCQEYA